MRKYFILSLIVSIIPNLCLAENPRITKLMREKQAKMEQLEKCMGSSKGLKIAGISTLGLTAVGVAGNIAEAKVIQDYNDRIESTDKNIEKTKIEIQEKRDALEAKEDAEAKRIAAEEQAKREGRILRKVALEDIARINSSGFNGDKAVSHGYVPEKLPENLRSQFANAMVNFIARCRSLIGQYGIEDVSLSPTEQENWRQYLGGTPLAEDTVLDDLNEHIIAECKIIKCDEKTHTFVNDGYSVRCDAKTVAGVPGADDKAKNGEKGNQDGDENNAEDLKNKKTQPTVVADDTDCITEAKKKDSDAKTAKYKNGVCKITACTDTSKKPSNDGQKCVLKQTNKSNTSKVQNINDGDYNGASVCSSTSGSVMGASGSPDLTGSGDAKYCWCKINKYKGKSINSQWLFGYANNTVSECNDRCKEGCTNGVNKNYSGFRDLVIKENTPAKTTTTATQTTPKTATETTQTGPKDYGNKIIFYSRVNPKYQGCTKSDRYARAEVDGKVYEYEKTGSGFGPSVNREETLKGLREKLNKDYKNYILAENSNQC